jgi:ABC-2 type transport system permease protein
VLFNVHWGPNLPMVIVVLLAFASFAAATGILIGNFSTTRGQAAAIGSLSANIMSAIGGCWWPAEIMPPWMQSLAKATPSGLTMDALHKLINFGAPVSSVYPHLIVLTIGALIAGTLVSRWFRFQ